MPKIVRLGQKRSGESYKRHLVVISLKLFTAQMIRCKAANTPCCEMLSRMAFTEVDTATTVIMATS